LAARHKDRKLGMQIQLNLSNHCIETEIKRLHERCISNYFKKSKARAALEKDIALLEDALATFDFGMLRSRYPQLNGHSDASIALGPAENGRAQIWIDGEPLKMSSVSANDRCNKDL
jgi:hypothetical protein